MTVKMCVNCKKMETLKKQQKINLEKYVHHESFSPLSTGAFQRPTLAARGEERSASVTMTVLPRVVASLAVPGLILCFITLPFPAILSQRPPLPTEPSPTPAPTQGRSVPALSTPSSLFKVSTDVSRSTCSHSWDITSMFLFSLGISCSTCVGEATLKF